MGEKRIELGPVAQEVSSREIKTTQVDSVRGEWADWDRLGIPVPRLLHRNKPAPLAGGRTLGQRERLEKPRLHSQGVYRCWLAHRQCGERFGLVAATWPCLPIWVGWIHWPCLLMPQLSTRSRADTRSRAARLGKDSIQGYRDSLGAWGVVHVGLVAMVDAYSNSIRKTAHTSDSSAVTSIPTTII